MEACDLQWSESIPLPLPFPPPTATPLHERHSGAVTDLPFLASMPTEPGSNSTYRDDERAPLYQGTGSEGGRDEPSAVSHSAHTFGVSHGQTGSYEAPRPPLVPTYNEMALAQHFSAGIKPIKHVDEPPATIIRQQSLKLNEMADSGEGPTLEDLEVWFETEHEDLLALKKQFESNWKLRHTDEQTGGSLLSNVPMALQQSRYMSAEPWAVVDANVQWDAVKSADQFVGRPHILPSHSPGRGPNSYRTSTLHGRELSAAMPGEIAAPSRTSQHYNIASQSVYRDSRTMGHQSPQAPLPDSQTKTGAKRSCSNAEEISDEYSLSKRQRVDDRSSGYVEREQMGGGCCNRHTCEEAGIVSELTDPIEREWDGDGRVISHKLHQEV
ncbi:hypothetical protein CERSUDRAFT_125947 [Gelatoporia subvermispora B]|uniref:Uncharacterized protein n=1 Tax=Ceriporiopsis subvermispora (strain B) TaxID=914234 RepID=M2Q9W1_CERS8|nr:hypothetical protein CERSUDRAFT_125947 [Gelatoporia subvermispora B]